MNIKNLLQKTALNIRDERGSNFLESLYGEIQVALLYRSSRDGLLPNDFHRLCDKKGATIALFQLHNFECIGGKMNLLTENSVKIINYTDKIEIKNKYEREL